MADIGQRKRDHLAIAASGDASHEGSTYLEYVSLTHSALPELALSSIELSTELAGQSLKVPIVITGMTGGIDEAFAINCALAKAAESRGVAFGLGSQRAMLEDPSLLKTFSIREQAPDVVLFGNLGVMQARQHGAKRVLDMCRRAEVNALCIHLNPAQEMIQEHGDRDFSGGLDCIKRLRDGLDLPIIVKETGCGLSAKVCLALKNAGIETVDASGAGGTSWTAVEAKRAGDQSLESKLGREYWNWGIPTAVSVACAARLDLSVIASGGIRSGVDAAKAIALGAKAVGLAAPLLKAYYEAGESGVASALDLLVASLKVAHLLCGSRTPADLSKSDVHIHPPLASYIQSLDLKEQVSEL